MRSTIRHLARPAFATLLAVSPLMQSDAALARYASPTGRICDEYMAKASEELPLDKQFNVAWNCIGKIKKETGRTHDAYLLWLSNIYEEQGMRDKAVEYAWFAIGATRENNQLDKRGSNDFLSISFLTLLLRMTGLDSTREQHVKLLSKENAETLYDYSLAVMKLSGCARSTERRFVSTKPFQQHADIDFGVVDTTLTALDKDGHCGMSAAINLLARVSASDNSDLPKACTEARTVIKRLSGDRYARLRSILGWVYLQLADHVKRGNCTVSSLTV